MEKLKKLIGVESNKLLIPFAIMFLGAVLMVTVIFLPFASAKGEFREELLDIENKILLSELNMTNEDAVDMSLTEYFKVYLHTISEGPDDADLIATMSVIIVFAIFALVTMFMAWFIKPGLAILFNVLFFAIFKIIQFDFESRNVIPSRRYDWGVANYIIYIFALITIVGAIWFLIENRKIKNEQKGAN